MQAKRESNFWKYKPYKFKQGTQFIARKMSNEFNSCINSYTILHQKGSEFQIDLLALARYPK